MSSETHTQHGHADSGAGPAEAGRAPPVPARAPGWTRSSAVHVTRTAPDRLFTDRSEQDGPVNGTQEPPPSREQLIGLQPLALIPARPSLLPGSGFPFTAKKETRNDALLKGTRGRPAPGRTGPDRTGPGRAYLRATSASHCSQGGRARSSTELHGASRSFSSAAARSAARQAGGGRALPACTHCAAARARCGDGADGQTVRSGPLGMLLSVPPSVTVTSGD